jgi:hypothetical protein
LGAVSLLWFLLRVGPKPSRAVYPCQRLAMPMAAGFLAWLLAVGLWIAARRKAVRLWAQSRYGWALACFSVALAALAAILQPVIGTRLQATTPEPHAAIGVERGLNAGRVVWVHAPDATDWAGPESEQRWYEDAHTNPEVVDQMMSAGIRSLAGQPTESGAWDALFRHFNATHGREAKGYTPGEKVAIKLNLVTCWAGTKTSKPFVDPVTRVKTRFPNHIDVAPQMVRALLRHLVEVAGVREADISVGDTTALWPDSYLAPLRVAYPGVQYVENEGGEHRVRAEFSTVPMYWSTPAAAGKVPDYIPRMFAEATYVINFTTLKGHSAGITLCGKNWYGALIRLPNNHLRKEGRLDYYELHASLPNKEYSPGTGRYRAMVDLLGHPDLGGKTVLNLVDGLYGGYYSDAKPRRWHSPPFGNEAGGDWPSSLFLSQDAVALDSVAHDFLLAEWPEVVTGGVNEPGSLEGGQEDYLHEAALAHAPPLGHVLRPGRQWCRSPKPRRPRTLGWLGNQALQPQPGTKPGHRTGAGAAAATRRSPGLPRSGAARGTGVGCRFGALRGGKHVES